MNYRGYDIEWDDGHYRVVGPDGTWTEDTEDDAKTAIDIEEDGE